MNIEKQYKFLVTEKPIDKFWLWEGLLVSGWSLLEVVGGWKWLGRGWVVGSGWGWLEVVRGGWGWLEVAGGGWTALGRDGSGLHKV